jgi:uncharacterized protein (DUF302 family)
MRPRTVIVFGNPKLGTPAMVKTPLLAIDVPPKALVWEALLLKNEKCGFCLAIGNRT